MHARPHMKEAHSHLEHSTFSSCAVDFCIQRIQQQTKIAARQYSQAAIIKNPQKSDSTFFQKKRVLLLCVMTSSSMLLPIIFIILR